MWGLDCNGLEEGQDVVAIICNGGQRLGRGLILHSWFCRLLVLYLYGDFAVFIVVVVFPAGVFPFLHLLRDGASKNIQELACVRLAVDYFGLREKWR